MTFIQTLGGRSQLKGSEAWGSSGCFTPYFLGGLICAGRHAIPTNNRYGIVFAHSVYYRRTDHTVVAGQACRIFSRNIIKTRPIRWSGAFFGTFGFRAAHKPPQWVDEGPCRPSARLICIIKTGASGKPSGRQHTSMTLKMIPVFDFFFGPSQNVQALASVRVDGPIETKCEGECLTP